MLNFGFRGSISHISGFNPFGEIFVYAEQGKEDLC